MHCRGFRAMMPKTEEWKCVSLPPRRHSYVPELVSLFHRSRLRSIAKKHHKTRDAGDRPLIARSSLIPTVHLTVCDSLRILVVLDRHVMSRNAIEESTRALIRRNSA